MSVIDFKILIPEDQTLMETIAKWYYDEWSIPYEKSILKLKAIANDHSQFQVVILQDSNPVATGGVYHQVGLLELQPRFNIHKHWLALVYTLPTMRKQGLGGKLCNYLEALAKDRGIREIHLFTDTAVSLYRQLGWSEMEVVEYGSRRVTVMKKATDSIEDEITV